MVLVQSVEENKGWDNHEDTLEEALRRELVSSRTEVFLLQEDIKQLTKSYYNLLRIKMETFVDRLRKELESDEGNVKAIYLCSESHPTFGIGHLITKNDPEFQDTECRLPKSQRGQNAESAIPCASPN